MKEARSSSEISVLTRATRRNIPEDAILHRHIRFTLSWVIRSNKFIVGLSVQFYRLVALIRF
jgi:hypothetical protein